MEEKGFEFMNIENNKAPNKLINEKSPYLLQHAYNPVQWYPWGKEALNKAREEDKLIFLSIGYSTCRWCHNMNRESFQDEEVGEILNKYFVPIKVDREEKPDIDKVYMTFSDAITGSGGWPLNLLLTPDTKPFFVGTYFPKRSKGQLNGLIELLEKSAEIWRIDKEKLMIESSNITEKVKEHFISYSSGDVKEDIFKDTKEGLLSIFDKRNGGFGYRPKFPMPQYILFLLEYGHKYDDEEAKKMAKNTLESIYKGGIFDHIGYGFCRYSVDEKWLVPHFEKMLYDNGLLAITYIKAYELTKELLYKEVAEKIFDFVIREMISKEGAFFSALDAETEGEEGKFYVFNYDEIIDVLGKEDGEFYCNHYDITKEGNFEGKNLPNLIGYDIESIDDKDKRHLEELRQKLFSYREKRIYPHRDEKILTSWNGIMISALAYGGKVFGNEDYINKAKKAADFIITNSIDKDGRLLSTYVDGESYNYGLLEDYTFFIYGLLVLYNVTKDLVYLKIGEKLNDDMLNLFWDEKRGGLFYYSNISEELVLRPKDAYDGATPSGNSIAALNMIKLYNITSNREFIDRVEEIIYTFGRDINNGPLGHVYMVMANMYL